jgi:hypothetical protein
VNELFRLWEVLQWVNIVAWLIVGCVLAHSLDRICIHTGMVLAQALSLAIQLSNIYDGNMTSVYFFLCLISVLLFVHASVSASILSPMRISNSKKWFIRIGVPLTLSIVYVAFAMHRLKDLEMFTFTVFFLFAITNMILWSFVQMNQIIYRDCVFDSVQTLLISSWSILTITSCSIGVMSFFGAFISLSNFPVLGIVMLFVSIPLSFARRHIYDMPPPPDVSV